MPKEIEKKFLLKNDSWKKYINFTTTIKQSYMYIKKGVVRVRIINNETAFLTLKSNNSGIVRNEYEYEIPISHAQEMIDNLCDSKILYKKRHHITYTENEWVIDEFLDENFPLTTAEIELNSIEQKFKRPEWLGKDISSDVRYFNSNLIIHPYSEWS